MTLRIRAHFDGRVLVPDEPVDLPVNQPLDVEVTPSTNGAGGTAEPRRAGWGKAIITHIAPDFDEPLEDFREYME
jgi:hypothetical protein